MNPNITCEQFDTYDARHQEAAERVSEWSRRNLSMLALSPQAIQQFPYSVLAFNENDTPLGHIAVTQVDSHEARVGGLVVDPAARRHGVGQTLVNHLLATAHGVVPEAQTFRAYANERSRELFKAAGGREVGVRAASLTGCNHILELTEAAQVLYLQR